MKKDTEVKLDQPELSNVELEPPTWMGTVSPKKLYDILGPMGFDEALWWRYHPKEAASVNRKARARRMIVIFAYLKDINLPQNNLSRSQIHLYKEEWNAFYGAFILLSLNKRANKWTGGIHKIIRKETEEFAERQRLKKADKMRDMPVDNCLFDEVAVTPEEIELFS